MESVLIIWITYLDTDHILIPGVNGVKRLQLYITQLLNKLPIFLICGGSYTYINVT